MTIKDHDHRDKLGLALAGGGFRASLFHIGVLRRLAELDMLRYVEVLSTVSGGSIVGALYVLLLKREIDHKARLDQADYLRIVEQLEQRMCKAIGKNLRGRLFMNPFGVLRSMLTEHSLGLRMARLYERYVYDETVRELGDEICRTGWAGKTWLPKRLRHWIAPGRICLSDIKMRPGGQSITDGIESYNRQQVESKGSAITQLVVNATSLNSGTRFWFSATEIGDWDHGNIRPDEINEILLRKQLITQLKRAKTPNQTVINEDDPLYRHMAVWWLRGDYQQAIPALSALFSGDMRLLIEPLCTTELGKLRLAKLPAWYLRKGPTMKPPVTGGISKAQHLDKFVRAIAEIAQRSSKEVAAWMHANTQQRDMMLDFVYELFILRLAENVSPNIRKDCDKLTLGEAIGASSNFPPVFPPFQITGFYDDIVVSRLGLTDGAVLDNIGITGLIDEHCTHIIASDTGVPLKSKQRSSSGRIGMATRTINILLNQGIAISKEALLERYRISSGLNHEIKFIKHLSTSRSTQTPSAQQNLDQQGQLELNLPDKSHIDSGCRATLQYLTQRLDTLHTSFALRSLALFGIDTPALRQRHELPISAAELAQIRTDLDAFSDIEMYALMHQGYVTTDQYIKQFMRPGTQTEPEQLQESDCPEDTYPYACNPNIDWHSASASPWQAPLQKNRTLVKNTIAAARYRMFRSLRMRLFFPWILSLTLVALALWSLRDIRISVDSLVQLFQGINLRDTYSVFAWLPDNLSTQSMSLPVLLIGITLSGLFVTLAVKYWFVMIDRLKRGPWVRTSRWAARLGRWPQSYKGNLLWAIWLPLPLLVALVIAGVIGFSHVFYNLPLLHKTRVRAKTPD